MKNIKEEINNCFVVPSTKEELLQITYNIQTWLQLANTDLQLRREKEAAEITLAVLEGIGMHYEKDNYHKLSCDAEIKDCCYSAAYIISQIMSNLSTRNDIKILTLFELQQIAKNEVFAERNLIDLKLMAQNKGVVKQKILDSCKMNY